MDRLIAVGFVTLALSSFIFTSPATEAQSAETAQLDSSALQRKSMSVLFQRPIASIDFSSNNPDKKLLQYAFECFPDIERRCYGNSINIFGKLIAKACKKVELKELSGRITAKLTALVDAYNEGQQLDEYRKGLEEIFYGFADEMRTYRFQNAAFIGVSIKKSIQTGCENIKCGMEKLVAAGFLKCKKFDDALEQIATKKETKQTNAKVE